MLNEKAVIERLQKESKSNPTVKAVLEDFANRKRTRSSVTVHSLVQRMKAAGHNYGSKDYAEVLKLLADSGIGAPVISRRGKVVALKKLYVDLLTLGKMISGEIQNGGVERRIHFTETPTNRKSIKAASEVGLQFSINGKPVSVNLPPNLTVQEISVIISRFQNIKTR